MLCSQQLDREDLDQFRAAVAEDYYFQVCVWGGRPACCVARRARGGWGPLLLQYLVPGVRGMRAHREQRCRGCESSGCCTPCPACKPTRAACAPAAQMLIDGLPIWGFIGKVEKLPSEVAGQRDRQKLSLFTHIHFDVLFNGDRVIQVDISTGEAPWQQE